MDNHTAYYFFEYINPRTGRPAKTRHRMTIEEARERHGDAYKPVLDSVEWRKNGDGRPNDFQPYRSGEVPPHMRFGAGWKDGKRVEE